MSATCPDPPGTVRIYQNDRRGALGGLAAGTGDRVPMLRKHSFAIAFT